MLKKLINECTVDMKLHTVDPILIKSGLATVSGPNMAFVETYRNGRREPYLPGSSLKGVIRSHAERIARTLKSPSACEPFFNEDVKEALKQESQRAQTLWCGEKLRIREKRLEQITNQVAYKDSCPACRLFGSTYYVGRFAVSDAYLIPGSHAYKQRRDGVGIDRYTGGASNRAKFDLEVLTDATFQCTIKIRNFEVWQLGWLAYVIQDFKDELIHVGSGKSRGLGRVRGEVQKVIVSYVVADGSALRHDGGRARLRGIGSLAREDGYGFAADDEVLLPEGFSFERPQGKLRSECLFDNGRDTELWLETADKWDAFIAGYDIPREMAHTKFLDLVQEANGDE